MPYQMPEIQQITHRNLPCGFLSTVSVSLIEKGQNLCILFVFSQIQTLGLVFFCFFCLFSFQHLGKVASECICSYWHFVFEKATYQRHCDNSEAFVLCFPAKRLLLVIPCTCLEALASTQRAASLFQVVSNRKLIRYRSKIFLRYLHIFLSEKFLHHHCTFVFVSNIS